MWQTNAKGNVLGGSTHLVSGLVLELQLDIPPNVPTQHTTYLLTFSVFVVMLWSICDCRSHRNIALFLPTLLGNVALFQNVISRRVSRPS